MRRPRGAGRGLLPDGGRRRVQPRQRSHAGLPRRPGDAPPGRPQLRRGCGPAGAGSVAGQRPGRLAAPRIDPGTPSAAVAFSCCRLPPAERVRLRLAARSRRTLRLAGGEPAHGRLCARNRARRYPPQQHNAAPGCPSGRGVRGLGDVHDRRSAARSGLDAGVLADRTESAGVGRIPCRTRRSGEARRTTGCLPRRRGTADRAPGLVPRTGVPETRRRHRGHLGALPGRCGQ